MKVFIPITDEMIEKGILPADMIPFQPGQPVLAQADSMQSKLQSSSSVNSEPGPTPSRSAEPAFSSSTYIAGPVLG